MAIEVDICKRLRGFTLRAAFTAGDFPIALLGASGSGKSMTLRCIAGVERPDSGRIVVDGHVLFDSARGIDLPAQKREVGLLFQSYALFPDMTVRENLRCGAQRTGGFDQIEPLLDRFDLRALADRLPHQLSGGQQQRVALARILANRPRLLLLDEPFSALDHALRWRVVQEVAAVIRSFSGTTILVSHNRNEVYHLAERVAVVQDGAVGCVRDKASLFARPQTMAEAALTGFENILPATRRGTHTVFVPGWDRELTCAQPLPQALAGIAVRAGAIRLAAQDNLNQLQAEVVQIWETPEHRQIVLSIPGSSIPMHWVCRTEGVPAAETAITIQLPPESIIPLTA